jgi:hypothetical protein
MKHVRVWMMCAAAGCNAPLSNDDVIERLTAHGVQVTQIPQSEIVGSAVDTAPRYQLRFPQPIDHDHPSAGTMHEEAVLIHRDTTDATPMVIYTTGYADDVGVDPIELTRLLSANQISIEHRFYGESFPASTDGTYDWSKLTIRQMADDEHAIIDILRQVYDGEFITAGKGKGGQTAIFHRRFYPDDVAGTVAYVPSLSLGAPDPRYTAFFPSVGPPDCHAAVHDLVIEMLTHRRQAFEARATADGVAAPVPVAVEAGVVRMEWDFWTNVGVRACASLPALDASDDDLYAFLTELEFFGPPAADLNLFYGYDYQSAAQLGFAPEIPSPDLAPYLLYADQWTAPLPGLPVPTFDPTAMPDIQSFVEHAGDHLLFVYGQWDPWMAGAFALGAAHDAAAFTVPEGTHDVRLTDLTGADRGRAFAMLKTWTRVTPDPTQVNGIGPTDVPSVEVGK